MSEKISPPSEFNFDEPTSWPRWRRRFEQYILISKFTEKSDEEKTNLLLYCMGEKSEDVTNQFQDKPKNFENILHMFDEYFLPKRNLIFERAKFNSKKQEAGETAEQFVTNLYKMATLCDLEKIEKEALALTWGAERCSEYIIGLNVTFETDHKPLLQILQTKNLDDLTPRLQRFRMRLMRFNYVINYVPGKDLVVPDSLSRSPQPQTSDCTFYDDTDNYVNFVTKNLPVNDVYLKKIYDHQEKDQICVLIRKYCIEGWPERKKIPELLSLYYQYRFDFSISNNLLLKGSRIVIPSKLQKEILDYIHLGHQGIVKCRRRAKMSVWWYGLSTQIENLVRYCPNCVEERKNQTNTFCKGDYPKRPWQIIAADLFFYKKWYLIVTDYYSRFFELFELNSMSEVVIIQKVKVHISHFHS